MTRAGSQDNSDLNGCLLARFGGTVVPDWLRGWLDRGLAGVMLYAGNITGPGQLRSLVGELRGHNPGLLIAVDEEGGIVTRLEAASGSSYPGNAALGALDDVALTGRIATSIGATLAGAGLNLDLAPVADLDASAANPVIGVRSFGADPALVAAHTVAFVAGVQASMVGACAKHFPGHGRTDADSHLELPSVAATLPELRASDLVPFRATIEAGVKSVMTAHVVYPEIDSVPATLSRRILGEVLRDELGFGGVIITDALDMAAIGDGPDRAAGAVAAMIAGADLLCLPANPAAQRRAAETLAAAIAGGDLSPRRVAEAAGRVGALAQWARQVPAAAPDPALGAVAAERGLLLDGPVVPLTAPPYVLDAGGRMSRQLEDSAGSLLGVLRTLLPGTDGIRLAGAEDATAPAQDRALAAAAGRPLVVVVRDAHRSEWQRQLLSRVLAARPDALVVGTGTAHDRALAGRSYLGTRGSSRASLTAAASLLAGRRRESAQPTAGREATDA
jgi:beta-N-acetylhexosaminidase